MCRPNEYVDVKSKDDDSVISVASFRCIYGCGKSTLMSDLIKKFRAFEESDFDLEKPSSAQGDDHA